MILDFTGVLSESVEDLLFGVTQMINMYSLGCPLPSNGHHQEFYIFSMGSQTKSSFATTARKGGQSNLSSIPYSVFLHVRSWCCIPFAFAVCKEIKMLRLHGELASIVRVHVVRLTVAFGVSVTPRERKKSGLEKLRIDRPFCSMSMERFTHPG